MNDKGHSSHPHTQKTPGVLGASRTWNKDQIYTYHITTSLSVLRSREDMNFKGGDVI